MTLATIQQATLKYAEAKKAEAAASDASNTFRKWVDMNFPGEGLPLSCSPDTSMNKVRTATATYALDNANNLKEVGGVK